MPAANMNRKNNKRELERAKGNLAWTVQHLQVVREAFYQTAIELAEQNQDVPESYTQTITQIDEVSTLIIGMGQIIDQINEGI